VTGDQLIRGATAAVVVTVAAFAAVVSYSHIYDVGRVHGQSGTDARLLPLSVDGLILAASLVMLHEARNKRSAPRMARCMLALGVTATVAANVAYGSTFGPVGAVISAWPALAFIGSVEMVMGMVRRARTGALAEQPAPAEIAEAEQVLTQVAADAESAAGAALAASFAAGNPLSQRQVMTRFGLGRATERKVRQAVTAQSIGHDQDL
jgi:hypothetical protein